VITKQLVKNDANNISSIHNDDIKGRSRDYKIDSSGDDAEIKESQGVIDLAG